MANDLYNVLSGNNGNNMSQMMNELRANPIQFLAKHRLNLPQNFQGGPQEMVQHLLNTGQMSQEQLNQLQAYVNRMPH